MKYLKVRNWDKFQSYRKDRGQPPWIKLHRKILREPEWLVMTDIEKLQLLMIFLIAAEREGLIINDKWVLTKQCGLDTEINIGRFVELGFLQDVDLTEVDGCHVDNQLTTKRQPSDAPDKNREEQSRVEEKEKGNAARFRPPSLQEVEGYCRERNNRIDAEAFIAFYESKNWMIGKNKMKSWKSAVITWEKRDEKDQRHQTKHAVSRELGNYIDDQLRQEVGAGPVQETGSDLSGEISILIPDIGET